MKDLTMEAAQVFFNNQEKLLMKKCLGSVQESFDFLIECNALIFENKKEMEEYFNEECIELSDDEDVTDALEVFDLGNGQYLYVEA